MFTQNPQDVLKPDFNGWNIQEVKTNLSRTIADSLRRGGTPALAATLSILSLAYLSTSVVASTMEGGVKALCVVLIALGFVAIAISGIIITGAKNAETTQQRVESPAELGSECGNEQQTRPHSSRNGSSKPA